MGGGGAFLGELQEKPLSAYHNPKTLNSLGFPFVDCWLLLIVVSCSVSSSPVCISPAAMPRNPKKSKGRNKSKVSPYLCLNCLHLILPISATEQERKKRQFSSSTSVLELIRE